MLESAAKLMERTIKVKGRQYKQLVIYVPRKLATDSAFPFKSDDKLRISILGDALSIEKAKLPLVPRAYVDGDDTQKKDNRKHAQASNFFWR